MIDTDTDLLKIIADSIEFFLKGQGFNVHKYDVKNDDSVYMRLDYGLCNSVRIGTEENISQFRYRYNVIIGGEESKEDTKNGTAQYFYNEDSYCYMLSRILSDRDKRVMTYGGPGGYHKMMNVKAEELREKSRFKAKMQLWR